MPNSSYISLTEAINGQPNGHLKKGERVKVVFVSNPSKWIRASQIGIIEWRLNSNKDIEIIRADYWGEDTISFEVEVMKSEALLTEKLIIGLIMSANPTYFYLAHKPGIEKTVAAVAEKAKDLASWTPSIATVAAVAVIYILLIK